ncbi:MAG: sugar isomerase [Phycisphaerae bacterium]|nr:sugar isomerase [Phycisphaerae bacterium]
MKNEERYTKFALIREMMETPGIIRNFKLENIDNIVAAIKKCGKLFFVGEGSSRIFSSKNAIAQAMQFGCDISLFSEGSYQAAEYDLTNYAVLAISNSGRTKETLCLCDMLRKSGHDRLFGLTSYQNSKLEALTTQTVVLSCGPEEAIAASKSSVEQALFCQSLLAQVHGKSIDSKLNALADAFESALTVPVDSIITEALARAETVYFAGRNDGVAEELTLKANEIVRKKSDFFEGTYLIHGPEEVISPNDVVIVINPYKSTMEKIKELLVEGIGLNVFAIASDDTIFPTVRVQSVDELTNYVYLAAGWNVLVEAGVNLDIDLDKAERIRKVADTFSG